MNIYCPKIHQRSFGTYPLRGETLLASVQIAVDAGYRAFDTAQLYENEPETGEALAASGLDRDELCITTKVHPDNFSETRFIASVEKSLTDLRVDYVDVLLLHWPPIGEDIKPSLKLLEEAQNRGLARNVGVSNYTAQMMRDGARIVDVALVTNQVEFHPLLNQDILLNCAAETGIPLSSYSPLARGAVFKHGEFGDIGKKYAKSAAQVVLRWIVQKGVSVNTMSTNPENIRANFAIMDFTLSGADMASIDALTRANYRIVGSNLVPWAPQWDKTDNLV